MNRLLSLVLFGSTCAGLIFFGQDFLYQEAPRYQAAESWSFLDSLFILVREQEAGNHLENKFLDLEDLSQRKKEVIDHFLAGQINLHQASLLFKEIIANRKKGHLIYGFFPRLSEMQIHNSMVINWASYHTSDDPALHQSVMQDLFFLYGDRYVELALDAGNSFENLK